MDAPCVPVRGLAGSSRRCPTRSSRISLGGLGSSASLLTIKPARRLPRLLASIAAPSISGRRHGATAWARGAPTPRPGTAHSTSGSPSRWPLGVPSGPLPALQGARYVADVVDRLAGLIDDHARGPSAVAPQ